MSIINISLKQLTTSAANVRKTGGQSIEDLAASIAAHGLLQNLTVKPAAKGKYEVVAGGRRLAALKRLVKEGKIAKDFAVPCLVIEDENATELSLAENTIRQAMHPADQFEAFYALAIEGMSIEDIAARFASTDKHVRRLLKLASVSPLLLKAYRNEEMDLETLMAFTVSNDHGKQESVWEAAKTAHFGGYHIRQSLTETQVKGSSPEARLIGEDAYVAAGGTITRDLFSEADEAYFEDPALLSRLVTAKLEDIAGQVRAEGWAWVETRPDGFNIWREDMSQLEPADERPYTPQEAAELERLRARFEQLHDAPSEDLPADEEDAIRAELNQIEERLDTLENLDRDIWSDAQKAAAGAVVALGRQGIVIERGLTLTAPAANDSDDPAEAHGPSSAAPVRPKEKPEFSEALLRDMTARHTQALQAALTCNPDIALDVLLHTLATKEFLSGESRHLCAGISLSQLALTMHAGNTIRETAAAAELDRAQGRWEETLPGDAGGLWQWLRNADQFTKRELLAYLVARSLDAVQNKTTGPKAQASILHTALGLDMADYWQPTRETYLSRVSKAKVLAAVREAVSPEAADAIAGFKKDRLIDAAEKKLEGTRWLPGPLKITPPAATPDDREEAA